jgi:hypothetical protein
MTQALKLRELAANLMVRSRGIANPMKKILTAVSASILAAALSLSAFAQTPAPAKAPATKTEKAAKPAATPAPTAQEIADAKAKGLVWANLNTKVYHTEGAMYGTTKHGKFMTKEDAEKAGFRAAKEPAAKKSATPKPAAK